MTSQIGMTLSVPFVIYRLVFLLLFSAWSATLWASSDSVDSLHAKHSPLYQHPSQYLARHAADPVAWQDYSPAVLATAKQQQKLIFLSSGYFACHWCHVMQAESFQDAAIADWLNTHFVSIKLDRELHVDLDSRLLDFVKQTRGFAGWPLNVVLTPEGFPLFGFVYLTPEDFQAQLQAVLTEWRHNQSQLALAARQYQVSEVSVEVTESVSLAQALQAFSAQAQEKADTLSGGFGSISKFPQPLHLQLLLALEAQQPDAERREFLETTLDAMAQLGLRDHIGGGFYRYVIDPDWHTPHFEKMLYDNALLINVYLQAAAVLQRDDYRQIAEDSADFLWRAMRSRQHLFLSALSALDDQDREGGVYLWTAEELTTLLSAAEINFLKQHWDWQAQEAFLPRWSDWQPQQPQWQSIRRTLLNERQTQRKLPKDHKAIAAWNGLALSALTEMAKHNPQWIVKIDVLYQLMRQAFLTESAEVNRAISEQGEAFGAASWRDYAYLAKAFWDYGQFRKHHIALAESKQLVDSALKRYLQGAVWQAQPLGKSQRLWQDDVLPSPASLLLELAIAQDLLTPAQQQRLLKISPTDLENAWDYPSYWLFQLTQSQP